LEQITLTLKYIRGRFIHEVLAMACSSKKQKETVMQRAILRRREALGSVLCALAAASALLHSPPSRAQGAGNPLIIGAPLAMTGPAGAVGVDIQRGAQLAVDQINAAGGVAGRKLKLDVQDTTGAPAQAVQLFGSYARNPDVIATLGPVNAAEVGAVTNLAASNKLVAYAPASAGTVPGVDNLKFNDWTFRLNQSQPTILGPMLDTVIGISKAKSLTVLNYSDNAAYVDAGNFWQKAAEAKGLSVQRIQFPSTTQDYSAIVTQNPPGYRAHRHRRPAGDGRSSRAGDPAGRIDGADRRRREHHCFFRLHRVAGCEQGRVFLQQLRSGRRHRHGGVHRRLQEGQRRRAQRACLLWLRRRQPDRQCHQDAGRCNPASGA
jgi:hypothetical protein